MRTAFLAFPVAFTVATAALPAAAVGAPDNRMIGRVLDQAGLVGVWGTDCDNASSTEWETIAADDRGVYQSIEGGDDYVSTYDIVSAERLNVRDIRMDMVIINDEMSEAESAADQQRITVVYRIEGDRQMTWSSVGANGEKLITRGVFADGERRSEWYHRCPNGRPVPPSVDQVETDMPMTTDDGPSLPDLHKAPKS
jgi:hypothetical protein